jgi:hypothetical protein
MYMRMDTQQSQADGWMEARVPDSIDIPFQSFSMFYKYKADYGEKPNAISGKVRQRLNVRVDVLFPGLDANLVSDFFWNSFSNTNMQQVGMCVCVCVYVCVYVRVCVCSS